MSDENDSSRRCQGVLDKTIPKRIGYLEIKLRQFAAFLVTFFAVEKSDWHVGPLPTVLMKKLNKPSRKKYRITTKVNPDDLELKTQKHTLTPPNLQILLILPPPQITNPNCNNRHIWHYHPHIKTPTHPSANAVPT
jgi:hypothetical protein